MKSIMQDNKDCYICGYNGHTEEHHIYYGTSNRKISEANGFKVYLCVNHHRGTIRSPWKTRTCLRFKIETRV